MSRVDQALFNHLTMLYVRLQKVIKLIDSRRRKNTAVSSIKENFFPSENESVFCVFREDLISEFKV